MSHRSTCPSRTGYRLRISLSLLLVLFLSSALELRAQSLSFTFKNESLINVINQISAQTGHQFVYDAAYVSKASPISFSIKSASVKQVLDQVVKGQSFTYQIKGKTIVLKSLQSLESAEFTIHGMVVDSLGGPLPGATIKVRNKSQFVKSDADGHFSIPLTSVENSIEVSFVGFLNEYRSFNESAAKNVVTIKMRDNKSLLSDVIVTGYQTISRERSSALATVLDNQKLNENINVDLMSALEGRVPGLLYQKNPTGMGVDKPILRGVGTISPNMDVTPLIVIDGLPTTTSLEDINPYDVESVTVLRDAAAASIYGAKSANGVIVVTTKKGSGAVKLNFNSDVFITQKPDLDAMHYASTSDIIDYEMATYERERSRYASTETMFAAYGDVANGTIKYYSPLYQLYRDRDAGKITGDQFSSTVNSWRNNDYIRDYTNNVWRNEFRQRYNLSLSSGGTKSNTFASINYDQTAQRMINNNDKRLNLYFKNTYNPKKWLGLTFGVNGNYLNTEAVDVEYETGRYTLQPRYAQIVDEEGNWVYADYVNIDDSFTNAGPMNGAAAAKINANSAFRSTRFNMLEALNEGKENQISTAIRAFSNVQLNLLKSLKFNTQLQYETSQAKLESYYDPQSYKMRYAYNALTAYTASTNRYTYALPAAGRFYQRATSRNSYTWRNQLSFDKEFREKHAIAAIGGFELSQTMTPRRVESLRYGYDPITLNYVVLDNFTLSQTGAASYIYGGNKTLSNGVDAKQSEIKHRYVSWYANGSYTYLGRYNITGSVRNDMADLLGVAFRDKIRPLWSAGLSWNASSEPFLSDIAWLSSLKLRATIGSNGNIDQTSFGAMTGTWKSDVLFPSNRYLDITLPNPSLRWEKVTTKNLGVDYAVFSNRLRGSVDLYKKKSSDLIVTTDLDPTVGASSQRVNAGALDNTGVDIAIGGDWLRSKKFAITTQVNLAFNHTEVKKVTRAVGTAGSYIVSPTDYFEVNTTYNSLYAYRFGGIQDGYPYFLDESGNPTIQFDANGKPIPTTVKSINKLEALERMGSLVPTYTGSLSQRFRYSSFELGMLFVFSGGNVMRGDVLGLAQAVTTDMERINRYSDANSTTQIRPYVDYADNMLTYATTISSMWERSNMNILKGDYIKLRNISLSYSIPNTLTKRVGLSSARLTAQANNLWYKSAAGDDIDPEVYSANSGTRNIPLPKSFLFGFNLSF
ncbi:SusC/RagA family TonB-linked outer membrane protein [Desertivirga arenae]|uniref:SusC/RagA family TonB-linked outer membrane protein n=1 Tax=Desertivirga arenae TaxID=2810309 RepID=UPI001A95B454|nr:SusC/RagA family TonB-linked outer membrane protein [Pedobacter sp. SYSU D00823]